MPERYRWQSALASLAIEGRALTAVADAGVLLCERQPGTQLVIRGNASEGAFSAAVSKILGVELPVTPKTAHAGPAGTVLWLGPDEWLAVMAADKLDASLGEALAEVHHAVVDVSHSRAVIGLEGSHARDVLMKGTNIDVHPRQFGPGNCVQAHLGRCHMLLHQRDDGPGYDIYVHRSFAVYAWKWLEDAAGEYGLAYRGVKDG
jgi:sarcosine oxidase subunit gamma